MGGSAWAWLGDMELDDALLGLGAAGVFARACPLAVGFLVNAAHCLQKDKATGEVQASAMYHEKRAFLDTFFAGHFFSVLDGYHSAGPGRGWVGELTADRLKQIGPACGLQDELGNWIECVAHAQPATLHLLISGPLLGRGGEICSALESHVLAAPGAKLFIWTYAGSFNLTHSSSDDKRHLRRLAESFPKRVTLVETTLKSGAWVCDPPEPFWGCLCPTAWSVEDAKRHPIGFDVSTDIQSVNMFFEEYSSPSTCKRGLAWIFERIAGREAGPAAPVSRLLRELELRAVITDLTLMVPPESSSMGKVREALELSQEQLESAYQRAMSLVDDARESGDAGAIKQAAKEYAVLYRGAEGCFLEAGCREFFPGERPYSGPRLDKRSILRCMAEGKLQGGATADVLVVLALVLFLGCLDERAGIALDTSSSGQGFCGLFCASAGTRAPPEHGLFQLKPSAAGPNGAFSVTCKPSLEMNEEVKRALAPTVDATIDAIVGGAAALRAAGPSPGWGLPHIQRTTLE